MSDQRTLFPVLRYPQWQMPGNDQACQNHEGRGNILRQRNRSQLQLRGLKVVLSDQASLSVIDSFSKVSVTIYPKEMELSKIFLKFSNIDHWFYLLYTTTLNCLE
jgi:hypothetical protein